MPGNRLSTGFCRAVVEMVSAGPKQTENSQNLNKPKTARAGANRTTNFGNKEDTLWMISDLKSMRIKNNFLCAVLASASQVLGLLYQFVQC